MLKLLSQSETKKVWLLDGKEVTVWNDHDRCLKCGRPLKNSFSRSVGRGHQCRFNPLSSRNVKVMLAITPSNNAFTGQLAGAGKADGETQPSANCQ